MHYPPPSCHPLRPERARTPHLDSPPAARPPRAVRRRPSRSCAWVAGGLVLALSLLPVRPAPALEPIPERLVVLTFDDSVRSHFEVVRPILRKYGFGATFFVTEGFDFLTNKQHYMTWEEIAELHRDGFEIGNHTRDHLGIDDDTVDQLDAQLGGIAQRCREHGIPAPTSFAWPGNRLSLRALPILQQHGITFARRGGAPEFPYEKGEGTAYEPGFDHPLLIPSAGDARPDWEFEDFRRAVEQARAGKIAVLQFHGVPDRAHPWVHTSPEKFEQYMGYLARENYQVIALRDLARFVDPEVAPQDPLGIIRDRQALRAQGKTGDNFRKPADDQQLRFWLENMWSHHGYSLAEMHAATGLGAPELTAAIERFGLRQPGEVPPAQRDRLQVLPYPGGRHPRSGFRDGAIRPQRETKLSLFPPWDRGGYVVADFPEAIWWHPPEGRELLYLAHTHVPTTWDRQGIELERLEWEPTGTGWRMERPLPNGVRFGTRAEAGSDFVRFEMWIENGSPETLRGLLVQNCVMLAAAPGFEARTSDNKVIRDPYVACCHEGGDRWIITAWQDCRRPWANPPCPCMHSDPQFPDCPPGETRRLYGWVSFYEGQDLDEELRRIERLDWTSPDF
jgi:peptidoglycan/xylan/chitin deacetylase (PgdA/CDA1 family)